MHGDRVVVRIGRIERDGRADGEIVRSAAPRASHRRRRVSRRRSGNFVVPHDDRIRQWIEIPEDMALAARQAFGRPRGRARDGRQLCRRSGRHDRHRRDPRLRRDGERPLGRIIEILGRPDDFGIDVEILIRAHHIPHQFPDDVLEQARAIPGPIPADEIAKRRDFRELDIVTIDGETARDFDDAVWVERLANGHWALQVHIADVSHYVRPGIAHRSRSAAARHQRLFSRSRRADAAGGAIDRSVLAASARRPPGAVSALLEIDGMATWSRRNSRAA